MPMVAVAEIKGAMPQADPHNYDPETGDYAPQEIEIPEPNKESV